MWNVVMAGVVIILVPTFTLFIAGNRQLIRGLTRRRRQGLAEIREKEVFIANLVRSRLILLTRPASIFRKEEIR